MLQEYEQLLSLPRQSCRSMRARSKTHDVLTRQCLGRKEQSVRPVGKSAEEGLTVILAL